MGLLKETLESFDVEDEAYLAFIFGHRLDASEFRARKHLPFEGVFWRTLIFFKQVFARVKLGGRNRSKVNYLIYAGSNNQYRALASTALCLEEQGASLSFLYDQGVFCAESREFGAPDRVVFSLQEALCATLVFVLRVRGLLHKLKASNNVVARQKYFDKFTQAYIYLPYAYALLRARQPKYLVMSNDHNTSNRCLKLAAERLGIPTVFMQHGSGNSTLPPLDFDYAFLDGMESVEKYVLCAETVSAEGLAVNSSRCTILLSGCKNNVASERSAPTELTLGVAINPHDLIDDVVALLRHIRSEGVACIIRAHPTQEQDDLAVIRALADKDRGLHMSVFGEESVGDFLAACSLLVAGSSSIHLEAALARIPTYYYQFGDTGLAEDYLHHVRGGIAKTFPRDVKQLGANDFEALARGDSSSANPIRRFSESFGTRWEGREGELVVRSLQALDARDGTLEKLYQRENDGRGFRAVYSLLQN
jgi:hypothetical protein